MSLRLAGAATLARSLVAYVAEAFKAADIPIHEPLEQLLVGFSGLQVFTHLGILRLAGFGL